MINADVHEKTLGLIQDFLPEGSIDTNTRMVAVNTLYLSAPWHTPFMEEKTHKDLFHGEDGDVEISFMHRTDFFKLGQNETYRILELPFTPSLSKETQLALYIVLPNEDVDLKIDLKILPAIDKKDGVNFVALKFPKFQLESKVLLKPTLMEMGLTLPFLPVGGFPYGKEGSEKMVLDEVIHAVKADFNEWGATCAASTGAIMNVTSFPVGDDEEIPFDCDRPFLFILADKHTKSILFMGKFAQPDAN